MPIGLRPPRPNKSAGPGVKSGRRAVLPATVVARRNRGNRDESNLLRPGRPGAWRRLMVASLLVGQWDRRRLDVERRERRRGGFGRKWRHSWSRGCAHRGNWRRERGDGRGRRRSEQLRPRPLRSRHGARSAVRPVRRANLRSQSKLLRGRMELRVHGHDAKRLRQRLRSSPPDLRHPVQQRAGLHAMRAGRDHMQLCVPQRAAVLQRHLYQARWRMHHLRGLGATQ